MYVQVIFNKSWFWGFFVCLLLGFFLGGLLFVWGFLFVCFLVFFGGVVFFFFFFCNHVNLVLDLLCFSGVHS